MNSATQPASAKNEPSVDLKLGCVTIIVRDYDEALRYYTEVLGFEKRMDESMGSGARWLTVAPRGQDVQIVLQKPDPAIHGEAHAKELAERIGQGTTWVLATPDCRKAYDALVARGAKFSSPPKQQPWGIQAVLQDLYGNSFALVELASRPR